jgi:hypothetical protein
LVALDYELVEPGQQRRDQRSCLHEIAVQAARDRAAVRFGDERRLYDGA